MDKRITAAWLTVLLSIPLLLSAPALAVESEGRAIRWNVIGGGGGSIQSPSYVLHSTLGQPIIGPNASTSYQSSSGYWYGVAKQYSIYLPLVLRSP